MDKTIGVYICSGCGIGDAIDLDKVEKVATDEYKVKLCKRHEALCRSDALDEIRGDIHAEGLERVVIAACSPRHSANLFDFGDTWVESVNYREQLAWCHEANDEDTDMLAEDMLRMGIVKADAVSTPTAFEFDGETFCKDVLVVGGGLAGLTAAKTVAALGYGVTIVEKEDALGGWANGLAAEVPLSPPYDAPRTGPVPALVAEIEAAGNVTVYTGSTIESIGGAPGKFAVTLSGGETFTTGAIIQATGAKPYDVSKVDKLGYAASPNVVTAAEFEAMLKNGGARTADGKAAQKVLFVQCAGSRDKDHLPYCSAECCALTLKQAHLFREQNPDGQAYVVYKDMRTPGSMELFYKAMQDDEGLFLTKGEVEQVSGNGAGPLSVDVTGTLVGDAIRLSADLVVLATGMVPRAGRDEDEKVLGLKYRLGAEIPEARYGFPDSDFICFPYETRRTGIYACGAVKHPMGPAEALQDAGGAALKAVQSMELISEGLAVHPRALDLSWPDFNLSRCTQCKRCTEECPFGALDEDAKGTPMPNPTRCRRCGVCMGACPERIVSFSNYSVQIVSKMIKSIEMPEEDEEKPRVLCLVCENDAYPSLDLAGMNRMKYSPFVRFVPVRCLGSVNVMWINDSLASGFDGVLLFGCKHGDDYQCHFIKGSELAGTRMDNVAEKLQQLALESERVQIHEFGLNEFDKIPEVIDEFMETIEEIGMNPFKDL